MVVSVMRTDPDTDTLSELHIVRHILLPSPSVSVCPPSPLSTSSSSSCPLSHKCSGEDYAAVRFLQDDGDTTPPPLPPPFPFQTSSHPLSSSHRRSSNKPRGPAGKKGRGGRREVTTDFIKTRVSINLQSKSHRERPGGDDGSEKYNKRRKEGEVEQMRKRKLPTRKV